MSIITVIIKYLIGLLTTLRVVNYVFSMHCGHRHYCHSYQEIVLLLKQLNASESVAFVLIKSLYFLTY